MRVVRKKRRQKEAGSLKTKIPTKAVPTAPIPVHTAYAVPKGRCWETFISRDILIKVQSKKPPYHRYIVVPCVSFPLPRQKVKATSKKPAIISKSQYIILSF